MISNYDYEVCHPSLEITDPTPNVYELFKEFDHNFFGNKLSAGAVSIDWCERMKTAAGVCSYETRSKFCRISLSKPLLSLRSRKDLVETMLHEMIHAYLFVTHNNRDRTDHGPNFTNLMKRINTLTGANITVYHNFHDEVHHYKSSWYRCNGPCRNEKPLFGYRKGKLDRGPCSKDSWYAKHKVTCRGVFLKVSEGPTKTSINKEITKGGKKQSIMSSIDGKLTLAGKSKNEDFPFSGKGESLNSPNEEMLTDGTNVLGKSNTEVKEIKPQVVPFSGTGQVLGSGVEELTKTNISSKTHSPKRNVVNLKSTMNIINSGVNNDTNARDKFSSDISMEERERIDLEVAMKASLVEVSIPEGDVEMSDFDKAVLLSLETENIDREDKNLQYALLASMEDNIMDVVCPVCISTVARTALDQHLDTCLQ